MLNGIQVVSAGLSFLSSIFSFDLLFIVNVCIIVELSSFTWLLIFIPNSHFLFTAYSSSISVTKKPKMFITGKYRKDWNNGSLRKLYNLPRLWDLFEHQWWLHQFDLTMDIDYCCVQKVWSVPLSPVPTLLRSTRNTWLKYLISTYFFSKLHLGHFPLLHFFWNDLSASLLWLSLTFSFLLALALCVIPRLPLLSEINLQFISTF